MKAPKSVDIFMETFPAHNVASKAVLIEREQSTRIGFQQ